MKFKYFFSFKKLEKEVDKIDNPEYRYYAKNIINLFNSIVALLQIIFMLSVSILLYIGYITFNDYSLMIFALFFFTYVLPLIALKFIRINP
jgi:hypothetical protein